MGGAVQVSVMGGAVEKGFAPHTWHVQCYLSPG
jgi:hypothetical protein